MAWLGAECHDGAVDEVRPVVSVEALRFGDLDFVRAALQDALVVGGDGVIECSGTVVYGFESFY